MTTPDQGEYTVTSYPVEVNIDPGTGELTRGHRIYFRDNQTGQTLDVFVPGDQFSETGARNYILDLLQRGRAVAKLNS